MNKNNDENSSDSQKNFVPLQQDNKNENAYGTDNNRGAEAVASEHDAGERYERLGLRAIGEGSGSSLGNRWDTVVYEEGLQSEQPDDLLGSARLATLHESDRLIDKAKELRDFIPSTIWESYGSRNKKPSGESIVFLDEKNSRVVKFKDPFAYVSLKNDNPYTALFEHHIHNYFFGDVSYRFLGLSQDPVSGSVRFAFEQPYIKTYNSPSREEITNWFKKRGFELTKDGFWYTDGYVSFTDVEGDNCIKDTDGFLHFIDSIIKFERSPKEVLSHYIEHSNIIKTELERAGIGVGSRFKIYGLNSLNDFEVKRIDYGGGQIVFGPLKDNKHPDYQREFEWPVDRVLDNIKLYQGSRWIQVDENRNEVVIPAAKQAILERAKNPSPHATLTDSQAKALDRYCTLFSDKTPKEDILTGLVDSMSKEFKENRVPDAWVKDMCAEIVGLAHGERREVSEGLKR